ncbi:hypothetical protein Asulf_01542 [Archaeoglobus sulfaticallidus PM70-1]|uniref:Uncharacterized protein n=1 Tax=Archaeoglobus sulfaticallidus PM70-1 TaxID=387631 RepID=N0BMQ1_9EURY|nr:hypothetical protein [Archaeoglobus sulfaticallidus]AGK61520.1 hypothetical protein Asulf_01542 [Archaeoglobus sulfaticallidus PM70-1]
MRKVKVVRDEEGIRPDCEPPFSVVEYGEDYAIVDTPNEVGEPATWDEVKNPIFKKIVVGDRAYSVGGRIRDTTPVYLDNMGRLCLKKMKKIAVQRIIEEENIIVPDEIERPEFVSAPETPLAIRNGQLGVYIRDEMGNEVFTTDPETEIVVAESGERIKLRDVSVV